MSRDVNKKELVRGAKTPRVTLADVARSAGVSQTAASFVLSGRREEMRISAAVEARVLRAARETGYRPNIVSRSLRTGTSHTIGFVSDTVATTAFAGHLIWGALDAAREQGHLLFIGETEGDADLEQQLIEAMHDRGVDGVVLASMYTRKIAVPKALTGRPAVLLNAVPAHDSPVPSVVPDEVEAGRTVARVLLDAGHGEAIGLIGAAPPNRVPKDSLAAVQRLQGITEAFHETGAEIAGAVPCPDWQPEIGYDATRRLLEEDEAVGADLLQRPPGTRRLPGAGRCGLRSPGRCLRRLLRRRPDGVLGPTQANNRRSPPLRARSRRNQFASRGQANRAERELADTPHPNAASQTRLRSRLALPQTNSASRNPRLSQPRSTTAGGCVAIDRGVSPPRGHLNARLITIDHMTRSSPI